MSIREHAITMHRYQHWAYEKLYALIRQVRDADYRRDCGLFFRSIHGTLNHLLLVDRLWLGRLEGIPQQFEGLAQEIEPDRAALEQAIYRQCERWIGFVADVPESRFHETQKYQSLAGRAFELPFSSLVLHVPNHGTHHRGQISAALTRFGLEAPEMDLPYFLLGR